MLRSARILTYFVPLMTLVSCSRTYNYTAAQGITVAGKSFIKLKGKRKLMAHDIVSLISNKTYEDSILLTVPSLEDGVIKGEEIPAEAGYYKYVGQLTINDGRLEVNLSYSNTDNKKVEPLSWNGMYKLNRK